MYLDRRQAQRHCSLALALLCSAGAAPGQTSANLTLLSAYTARGVALDRHALAQLRIEHDFEAGWYAGGFASPVTLDGVRQAQLIAYAGRAQRLGAKLSADAGVSRVRFGHAAHLSYTEVFVGLALARANLRLLYSPVYYGGGRTLYLDLNYARQVDERLTLSLHAGVLHPFGEYRGSARDGADLRLALATSRGHYQFQAGVQTQWRPYLPAAPAPALTAGISRHF